MKKLFLVLAFVLPGVSALAQSPISNFLSRFEDPEKGSVTFIEKGNRAFGISGGYRRFTASGETDGDGFSILTLLNIGEGQLQMWSVSPTFSWFVANDVSLGVSLDYSGYLVDTDLRIDLRDVIASDSEALNFTISSRHMEHHKGGVAFSGRRYLSFFGSKVFGIFAEGRLYGQYGTTNSHPRKEGSTRLRVSTSYSAGLKIAGGAAVRLRDNSALSVSIPIIGAAWSLTHQEKTWKENTGRANMSSFNISRDLDYVGVQFGYVRYIKPKR